MLVEAPKKDEKPGLSAKYDGGVKLATADDKFELKLGFKDQVRFDSSRSFDEETPTRHNQFRSRFELTRVRFGAEGHFFGKDNRFKLEAGLGDGGSFAFVKDFFVEKRLPGSKVWFRAGQWKRPFNRAELVSDFASTFNERSIQNELAGGGRSIGVAVHDDYEKSPEGIEWVVGLFNTFNGGSDRPTQTTACTQGMAGDISCVTSRPTTLPADFGPTLVARVGYNSPKMKGYSESDLEGGPLRYAVGASYKVDLANFAEGAKDSWADNTSHGLELDAIVKAYGFSVDAGVVMMKIKDADPEYGLFVQPSMMFLKTAEVAGRFALTTVTQAGAMGASFERDMIEVRGALNYYFHGHHWKMANDVGFVMLTGDQPSSDNPDLQIRMMLQMAI